MISLGLLSLGNLSTVNQTPVRPTQEGTHPRASLSTDIKKLAHILYTHAHFKSIPSAFLNLSVCTKTDYISHNSGAYGCGAISRVSVLSVCLNGYNRWTRSPARLESPAETDDRNREAYSQAGTNASFTQT